MANASAKERGALWRAWPLAAGLGAYAVLFGGFAFLASGHLSGASLVVTLVFVECALMAAVAIYTAAELDLVALGVGGFAWRLMAVCGIAALVSCVILVLTTALRGADPPGGALAGAFLAQLVILGFCALLGGVYAVVRCLGAEPFFAQFVSVCAACALIGTIFYADPIIEAQKTSRARSAAIEAVLAVNPTTAISWSLLQFDVLRREVMYDRISVIGRYYQTLYPAWWKTFAGYGIVSAALLTGAWCIRRRRGATGTRR